MGILDSLFGSRSSKTDAVIRQLYNNLKEEVRPRILYPDFAASRQFLTGMTKYSCGRVTEATVRLCFDIHLQTWIRSHGGFGDISFSTAEGIQQALTARYEGIDAAVIGRAIGFSLKNIQYREPELIQRNKALAFLQQQVHQNSAANKGLESRHMNDPDYGLRANKPVFVNGFPAAREYLSHLRAADGRPLTADRQGSIIADGINGSVDVYQLSLPDQSPYATIFLCNYGTETSTRAPANLTYVP